METKQIYKALAEINKEVQAIGKNRKNEQQGFKFRGIDDVMNELHDLFAKHEVIILPNVLSSERSERINSKGTAIFSILLTVKFVFVANDGSSVDATVLGEAMDSGDKGANKALSIALKYALLQMFLIPTEEPKDPDLLAHELKAITPKDGIVLVKNCKTLEELQKVWTSHNYLQKDAGFLAAKEAKKVELTQK